MAKYLFIGSYTADGVKGLLKEGGTGRSRAAEEATRSVGGTLEAFYFGFGQDDWYVIADVPSASAAAAVALRVSASGTSRVRTVALITPDEMDQAARTEVSFRPPGG